MKIFCCVSHLLHPIAGPQTDNGSEFRTRRQDYTTIFLKLDIRYQSSFGRLLCAYTPFATRSTPLTPVIRAAIGTKTREAVLTGGIIVPDARVELV